jgi:hypothetical protein
MEGSHASVTQSAPASVIEAVEGGFAVIIGFAGQVLLNIRQVGIDGAAGAEWHFNVSPREPGVLEFPSAEPTKRFNRYGIARVGSRLSLIEEGQVPGQHVRVPLGRGDHRRDILWVDGHFRGEVAICNIQETLWNLLPADRRLLSQFRIREPKNSALSIEPVRGSPLAWERASGNSCDEPSGGLGSPIAGGRTSAQEAV